MRVLVEERCKLRVIDLRMACGMRELHYHDLTGMTVDTFKRILAGLWTGAARQGGLEENM